MLALKLAILMIAAVLISRSLDVDRFLALVASLPWYLFIAGGAIVLLQAALMAARWKRVASYFADAHLSFTTAFTAILISFFFSQGLPASIGGDAARVWLLKEQGGKVRAGVKAVLIDRFWGLLSLVFLACCGLLALAATRDQMSAWQGVITAAAIFSAGLVVATVPWPSAFLTWGEGLVQHYLPFAASIADSLSRLKRDFDAYNSRARRFRITVVESVLVHVLMLVVASLPLAASPQPAPLLAFYAAIPPALLVSYLPISIAGWGVREGALIVSLGLIGISLEQALLISLFIGCTVLLVSLIGGLLWLASATRKVVPPEFATEQPDHLGPS